MFNYNIDYIKEILEDEFNDLSGKDLFSNSNGDNTVTLDEIESENDQINLYCIYRRKYYQTAANVGNGVAGWNKENKSGRGVPFNIEITFKESEYDDSIIVGIDMYYNGHGSKAVLVISDEDVDYIDDYEEDSMDAYLERNSSNNPHITTDAVEKTIGDAMESITEVIRVKLTNIVGL